MRIVAIGAAHDSSVTVLNNGSIEFFCKEERLSGVKRDSLPIHAIDKAQQTLKGPVDVVLYTTPSNVENNISDGMFKAMLEKKFNSVVENYTSMNHHLCHAALAYTNSNFSEALVFVIDRNGSEFLGLAREAETVFKVNAFGFKPLQRNFNVSVKESERYLVERKLKQLLPSCEVHAKSPYGIVSTYEAATTLIGQNPLENGKTMGLAAYSDKVTFKEQLFDDQGFPISSKLVADVGVDDKRWYLGNCFYEDLDKITDEVTSENYLYYSARAKQVQTQTQEQALKLIKKHVENTGITNVCLVGGYGLNVVANNYYIKNLPDVNFYFEPVADDTGISLGAAMLKYYETTGSYASPVKDNFYHYYEEEPIIGKEVPLDKVVSLLAAGKSVAIFEGNPEAGPRALGHRSILMDPSSGSSKDAMNKIKNREWYRPFAGVILEEEFSDYFETNGLKSADYMTVSFKAKQKAVEMIPGVIHVDGTCRVQTVNSGTIHSLLARYKRITGRCALMNTSFNLAGYPLVQTKEQALWTLASSALDYVVFVENGKYFIV